MRNRWLRAIAGLIWGLSLFLAVAYMLRLGMGSVSATLSQAVLKPTLIVIALAAWKLLGLPYREMGWCRAEFLNRASLPWYGVAAVIMAGASAVMVLLGVKHPLASQMRFIEIVLVIWGLSSVSEEIYVRGLVQSWVTFGDEASAQGKLLAPSIVSSALLFAALHVPLMWSPIGVRSGLPIVLATFGVGYACAVLRARSRSLWPAIACHVIGNVSGVPGAILGVVIYRLLYGRLPQILTTGRG